MASARVLHEICHDSLEEWIGADFPSKWMNLLRTGGLCREPMNILKQEGHTFPRI